MPEMTVWFVSLSLFTRKVGSSSERAARALDSLSWSSLLAGSTATEMTGSGKSIFSRMIGASMAESVSPVEASFRPTKATMSPVLIWVTSSRVLACILRMRPTRSLRPLVALRTWSPEFSVPEYTRT